MTWKHITEGQIIQINIYKYFLIHYKYIYIYIYIYISNIFPVLRVCTTEAYWLSTFIEYEFELKPEILCVISRRAYEEHRADARILFAISNFVSKDEVKH